MKILVLILTLTLLIITTVSYAGDRRSNTYANDGQWITIPDVGECNDAGCVLKERSVKTWDGHNIIHQWIDRDGDGACDVIMIFKPIVDPQYGLFYTLYQTKSCYNAI